MPKAFSNQHSWYLATLSSVSPNSRAKTNTYIPFSKLIYTYNHVIQGFSASLTPAELEALKNAPGYVSSVKDTTVKVDTTHSFKFLGLNSGTGAWPVSNFGKDVIIGDACDNTTELREIKHKMVVCRDPDGDDSLNDQVNNVHLAGNTAGVFITNTVDISVQTPFPAIFLEQKDGDAVVDFIKHNTDPKASIEFKKTILGIKPSPRVASYTSRGPSYSCPSVLKPDIMAPGDSVLAADAKPNSTAVLEFQRTVTNVGDGSSTYRASVTPINGLKVTVEPDVLVFKAKYEKKNFKLSVEGPRQLNEAVSFGYLTWEDSGRRHVVRSPIVATSYKIEK
ncbi:hypothetical protein V6N11_074207 [Hibiscus sabdariffa]|uniref:Uncharacterized protein n=1 Tax=Hibiscus sabdariffa TaxID=183260 RepID=A0ABR2NJG5_9ROSI